MNIRFVFAQVAKRKGDPSMVVRIDKGQKHGGDFYTVEDRRDEKQVLHRRDNARGERRSLRPLRKRKRGAEEPTDKPHKRAASRAQEPTEKSTRRSKRLKDSVR